MRPPDKAAGPSRRRVLTAAAAGAVVLAGGAAALAVAEPRLYRRARAAAGWPVTGPDAAPSSTPGSLVRGSFASSACRREVGYRVAYPPGAEGADGLEGADLPVVLVLHGRGGSAATAFDGLHLDGFLADVVTGRAGRSVPPCALVSVDGGADSYWHRRASGVDPQAMLLDELLPLLAGRGLETERFGLFGWSMGGYGSLLLAQTVGAARVVAVAADSPALWHRYADAAAGAFDDAADFTAHDVLTHAADLAGVPVRLACGDDDPFSAVTHDLADALPDLAGAVYGPGGHDRGYWRSTAVGQLTFLADALAGS